VTHRLRFSGAADLPAAVAAVAEAAERHAVVAVPTETFYGLAVPPDDAEAVQRLLEAKGRPAEKALPVVGASLEQLEALVAVPATVRRYLSAVWPAPLTAVLPLKVPVAWRGETLAVRVPAHPLLRALLARLGPRTATSANRSGAPPARCAGEVEAALGAAVDLLLDGGTTSGGAPSTIVDFTTFPPILLRPGVFAVPEAWGVKSA